MRGSAFVRAKPFDPLPPPLIHSGAIGWLRENLFSSVTQYPADRLLRADDRLARAAARQIPDDRRGVGRRQPRRLRRHARSRPRGRRLLGVRDRAARLLHLRLLSDRGALAGRCVLRAAGLRHRLDGLARCAAARPRHDLFLRRDAGAVVLPAGRLAGDRTAAREHRAMGRRAGHHRGRRGRHRGVAAARHSAGARAGARKCRWCGWPASSSSNSCAACR